MGDGGPKRVEGATNNTVNGGVGVVTKSPPPKDPVEMLEVNPATKFVTEPKPPESLQNVTKDKPVVKAGLWERFVGWLVPTNQETLRAPASCTPQYLGFKSYLGSDCVVRGGGLP